MRQLSIWANNTKPLEFKTLGGDKKTDILIIGGRMCGLLCAYLLHRAGVEYISILT